MKQVVLLTGAFLPATSKLCKIWLATRLHKTTEQTLRAVVGSATLQQSLIANRIVTAYPRLFERPRSQAFRWHWVQAMRELKGVMAPSSTLVHVMSHDPHILPHCYVATCYSCLWRNVDNSIRFA